MDPHLFRTSWGLYEGNRCTSVDESTSPASSWRARARLAEVSRKTLGGPNGCLSMVGQGEGRLAIPTLHAWTIHAWVSGVLSGHLFRCVGVVFGFRCVGVVRVVLDSMVRLVVLVYVRFVDQDMDDLRGQFVQTLHTPGVSGMLSCARSM